MRKYFNNDILTTGLAAFSMFFGAGNVVFPLIIGKIAGSQALASLAGFLITAVGLPFLGLVAMSYFNGDYEAFFSRIGRIPGSIFIHTIMALIGPLAAMPRLVTVSHSAIKMYLPQLSLFHFSLLSAVIIFIFSAKKSKILEILGKILSPILLGSLAIIIFKGLFGSASSSTTALVGTNSAGHNVLNGLIFGYNTMDLYASIFFSTVILSLLKLKLSDQQATSSERTLARNVIKSGAIAASLLGIIYLGLGIVASLFTHELINVPSDEILPTISHKLLGFSGGIISSIAVALACLTTAITLACVFADFLRDEVSKKNINYPTSLAITLFITTIFANLGFEGIMKMLTPILSVIYPASIVLTICNLLFKTKGIKTVKAPVFITFAAALLYQIFKFVQ